MSKMHRTSKTYLNEFKREFLKWVGVFGLKQYRIDFLHEDIGNRYAQIRITEYGKIANVYCNLFLDDENLSLDQGPASHAKHEAVHLLLSRLSWLARSRCIAEGDLEEEEEAIIERLIKVIK